MRQSDQSTRPASKPDAASYPYNLGSYIRPLAGASAQTQSWFDYAINWAWAFNHLESARCFEHVIAHDPTNLWGHWGLAYALGPNYNKPWEMFDPIDLAATLDRIRETLARTKDLEGDGLAMQLVVALSARYGAGGGDDFTQWSTAYADAMVTVYEAHSDDADVAALYADALMNLAPWDLWDITTGEPRSAPRTSIAKSVLESALQLHPSHPGLLHLYVHLVEMSPFPEIAVPYADRLRGMCPDGGHLEHMPTHLDLLVGDWKRAIAGNLAAIVADDKYAHLTSATDFYSFYRLHNVNTLIFAAMLGGNYATAMQGVDKIEALVGEDVLRTESPPMADWLEVAFTSRAHVLIRFGQWHDILALSLPADQALYAMTTATVHYARGLAHSVLGNLPAAEAARQDYIAAIERVPATRVDYPNKCSDLLAIGVKMLDGELLYRRGAYDQAFAHLRRAVELYDNLLYTEPYSWKLPPRHALGALLLEQGRVEEAAREFGADLGLGGGVGVGRQREHPNNPWALSTRRDINCSLTMSVG
ncbi:hypothetical protein Q5752_003264 [Cryptotrichosporon argae]